MFYFVGKVSRQDLFAEIYFAQADIPSVGRNLLGDSEYQWLMGSLKKDEHAIIIFGNVLKCHGDHTELTVVMTMMIILI